MKETDERIGLFVFEKKGNIDYFVKLYWRRQVRITWSAKRTNKYVLDIIKPEISIESNILKQKLQYFGHNSKQ
jgi:hypothetical protein